MPKAIIKLFILFLPVNLSYSSSLSEKESSDFAESRHFEKKLNNLFIFFIFLLQLTSICTGLKFHCKNCRPSCEILFYFPSPSTPAKCSCFYFSLLSTPASRSAAESSPSSFSRRLFLSASTTSGRLFQISSKKV